MQPMLVGRDEEMSLLTRDLAEARSTHGLIAVIEGEAGIGKTRLLRETSDAASAQGFTVLSGAGYELGHEHMYDAIAEALDLRPSSSDPRRAAIGELLRHPPSESHYLEFRLVEDILALVERLSIERPVILTMDDLQWVDSASLLSLVHLTRHLAPLRLAVIVAVRAPPRRPQVDQFLRFVTETARWVELGPLSRAAVETFLVDLVGGRPGPMLMRQISGAAGNPLFVRELADALLQAGSLKAVDGTVELNGQPLQASIHRLLERRLSSIPASTARLLRTASLLGTDFSLTDLADFLGQSAADVAETLQPALDDGLLGELDDRLTFRHQLVREAIYHQMPQAVRSALHQQIGRKLALRGADAIQAAGHLVLGGETARAEAVDSLRRAAEEARSRSPVRAIELLDAAIEQAGFWHPAREEMLVDRILALTWAGRVDEALKTAREMLTANMGGPLKERLHLGLARALMVHGRWRQAVQELEILAARPEGEEVEQARLLGDAALASAFSSELDRAVAMAEDARRIGELLGDELAQSIAFSSLAVVAHFEARHLESVKASRQALALAVRSRSPEAALRPTALWLGLGLVDAD